MKADSGVKTEWSHCDLQPEMKQWHLRCFLAGPHLPEGYSTVLFCGYDAKLCWQAFGLFLLTFSTKKIKILPRWHLVKLWLQQAPLSVMEGLPLNPLPSAAELHSSATFKDTKSSTAAECSGAADTSFLWLERWTRLLFVQYSYFGLNILNQLHFLTSSAQQ